MKTCNKCGINKSFDCFYRRPNGNYRSPCKECASAHAKVYYQQTQEDRKAYGERYRKENQEVLMARQRQWTLNNPEQRKEHKAKWREENRDKIRSYNRIRKAKMKGADTYVIPSNIDDILYVAQNGLCGICKEFMNLNDILETDHWIPLKEGGTHSVGNLMRTHRTCNRQKLNKLPNTERVLVVMYLSSLRR